MLIAFIIQMSFHSNKFVFNLLLTFDLLRWAEAFGGRLPFELSSATLMEGFLRASRRPGGTLCDSQASRQRTGLFGRQVLATLALVS